MATPARITANNRALRRLRDAHREEFAQLLAEERASHGLPARRLELDIEAIVREYEAGDSTIAIAHRHGVATQTIANHLRRAGVELRRAGRTTTDESEG